MARYLVRVKASELRDGRDALVGMFTAQDTAHLFSKIDDEMDPYVCEWAQLKASGDTTWFYQDAEWHAFTDKDSWVGT